MSSLVGFEPFNRHNDINPDHEIGSSEKYENIRVIFNLIFKTKTGRTQQDIILYMYTFVFSFFFL